LQHYSIAACGEVRNRAGDRVGGWAGWVALVGTTSKERSEEYEQGSYTFHGTLTWRGLSRTED